MTRTISKLEKEIRALAPADQERLFRVLVEELDGPTDSGVEQAWLEEVQRRSRELDEGTVKTIPGDEVFARLREGLKR